MRALVTRAGTTTSSPGGGPNLYARFIQGVQVRHQDRARLWGADVADRRPHYTLAAMFGAGATGIFFVRPACNVHDCGADYIQTLFLALAAGAMIGVVGMALFFVGVNARYALANRALAKRRQRKPPRDGE
ncbi:MAG: hypothetical protein QOE61_704 [Micromonosporaceae bacterium]|nr:hypothetical protein [Micromonosporaceae bacterium]